MTNKNRLGHSMYKNGSELIFFFVLLFLSAFNSQAIPIKKGMHSSKGLMVAELTCEYQKNPLGVGMIRPRLGWILSNKTSERGQYQTAFCVQVASSEQLLLSNKPDIWNSETVHSPQSNNIIATNLVWNSLYQDNSIVEEIFDLSSVGVLADSKDELLLFAKHLLGHLTATVHGTDNDLQEYRELIDILQMKVGRLVVNGFPTGVEVTHAMVHGGPYPATTDSRSTSVGTTAIYRFTRPVCYQDFPDFLLPAELKEDNPLQILRTVNGGIEW